MKKSIIKIAALLLALILTVAVFSGCEEKKSGVGRGDVTTRESETGAPTSPSESGDQPTVPSESDPVASEPEGSESSETDPVESSSGGTSTIVTPPAGKVARPADLSAIEAIPRDFFNDAAADGSGTWYMGKTEYDPATGEVTTIFERSAETLALLDKYGAIYLKNADQKVCYFTFDCGYEYNGVTGQILDVLKEKNVQAVFFVTGAYIDSDPSLHTDEFIGRMLSEGHLVGTHTNNHKNMALLSAEEFIDEILSNEEKLKAHFPDAPDMVYYRPPMGATSEWALAMAKAMGLTTVMWSWTQYDYDTNAQPDPSTALENAKRGLRPGCVYLLHAVSTTNAAILGDLIDFIRSQGYEIRRIDK